MNGNTLPYKNQKEKGEHAPDANECLPLFDGQKTTWCGGKETVKFVLQDTVENSRNVYSFVVCF